MMYLSTMKKVVDTLDENWTSDLAYKIVKRWEYDENTVKYYRASANFIFIFQNGKDSFFLRFNKSCSKSKEKL